MTTALDLITSSMRLIGAIASGETPTADEANDALATLNDMISSWALRNLLAYQKVNSALSLVGGTQSYTIGTGGAFNVDRPISINGAFVTSSGVDFPLRVLTTEEWNSIELKSFAAPIPNAVYYVPAFPLGTVWIWPSPSLAIPLTLSVNLQFATLSSLAQTINYPPGYAKAMRYCLAVELAPEYGIEPSPAVVKIAGDEIGAIKTANAQRPVSRFDPALVGGAGTGLAGFIGGY
jgi:hypothetical protein